MKCETIQVREFELIPEKITSAPSEKEIEEETKEVTENETEKVTETEAVKEPEPEPEIEKWYSIDNDNYEVKPIRATLLPDVVRMFSQVDKRY